MTAEQALILGELRSWAADQAADKAGLYDAIARGKLTGLTVTEMASASGKTPSEVIDCLRSGSLRELRPRGWLPPGG